MTIGSVLQHDTQQSVSVKNAHHTSQLQQTKPGATPSHGNPNDHPASVRAQSEAAINNPSQIPALVAAGQASAAGQSAAKQSWSPATSTFSTTV